jgi:heat shock protein HslJ
MVVFVSITDKEWVAVELDNEKIKLSDVNQFPRMKLSEGKISGFSSCNRMNGAYTMEKEKISFGPIAVTKMLCFETQEVESKYLKLLSEVKLWEYEQGKLHFFNDKKQIIIVFEEKK